jgi:hypothetical protein
VRTSTYWKKKMLEELDSCYIYGTEKETFKRIVYYVLSYKKAVYREKMIRKYGRDWLDFLLGGKR